MEVKFNTFITDFDRGRIVQAIRYAEKRTSGEIRVHIEHKYKGGDVFERAKILFEQLGMVNTKDRNGVLIYLAINKKSFAILGDAGINEKVPANFWDDIKTTMEAYFKKSEFGEGLVTGVELVGEKLAQFFPHNPDDVNELEDTISEN